MCSNTEVRLTLHHIVVRQQGYDIHGRDRFALALVPLQEKKTKQRHPVSRYFRPRRREAVHTDLLFQCKATVIPIQLQLEEWRDAGKYLPKKVIRFE